MVLSVAFSYVLFYMSVSLGQLLSTTKYFYERIEFPDFFLLNMLLNSLRRIRTKPIPGFSSDAAQASCWTNWLKARYRSISPKLVYNQKYELENLQNMYTYLFFSVPYFKKSIWQFFLSDLSMKTKWMLDGISVDIFTVIALAWIFLVNV